MKVQTGMRLDSLLWCDFRKLCEKLHVRPSEPFEAFLGACVGRGDLGSVLGALRAQSPSEKLANELKPKRELMGLQTGYDVDVKLGEIENYLEVQEFIRHVTLILPRISDLQLIEEAKRLVERTLGYYGPMVVEDRIEFRKKEKLWEQEVYGQIRTSKVEWMPRCNSQKLYKWSLLFWLRQSSATLAMQRLRLKSQREKRRKSTARCCDDNRTGRNPTGKEQFAGRARIWLHRGLIYRWRKTVREERAVIFHASSSRNRAVVWHKGP